MCIKHLIWCLAYSRDSVRGSRLVWLCLVGCVLKLRGTKGASELPTLGGAGVQKLGGLVPLCDSGFFIIFKKYFLWYNFKIVYFIIFRIQVYSKV